MQHVSLPIGTLFKLDGEVCKKTSQIGFTRSNDGSNAEEQFTFDNDKRIELIPTAQAAQAPQPPAAPPRTVVNVDMKDFAGITEVPSPVKKAVAKPAVKKKSAAKKSASKAKAKTAKRQRHPVRG